MKKPIILAIDDDPVILNSIMSILRGLYDVRPVPSGSAALNYLSKYPADLILLDRTMPGMDGFEVLERLLGGERTRGIPVIFLTGAEDPSIEVLALESGASDFMTKPVRPVVLLSRVAMHIELARYRKAEAERRAGGAVDIEE